MREIKNDRYEVTWDVAKNATSRKSPATPQTHDVQDTFAGSAKLDENLSTTPDVRADAVARAKELIADSNYPDTKTIESVAKRLANKINP
jgi:hypothetical protein